MAGLLEQGEAPRLLHCIGRRRRGLCSSKSEGLDGYQRHPVLFACTSSVSKVDRSRGKCVPSRPALFQLHQDITAAVVVFEFSV